MHGITTWKPTPFLISKTSAQIKHGILFQINYNLVLEVCTVCAASKIRLSFCRLLCLHRL
jgi:hypothetical protein